MRGGFHLLPQTMCLLWSTLINSWSNNFTRCYMFKRHQTPAPWQWHLMLRSMPLSVPISLVYQETALDGANNSGTTMRAHSHSIQEWLWPEKDTEQLRSISETSDRLMSEQVKAKPKKNRCTRIGDCHTKTREIPPRSWSAGFSKEKDKDEVSMRQDKAHIVASVQGQ